MYPAGTSTDRVAPKDMYVGGYLVPKDTVLWISLYAVQNLASIHVSPSVFRPVSANMPWVVGKTHACLLGIAKYILLDAAESCCCSCCSTLASAGYLRFSRHLVRRCLQTYASGVALERSKLLLSGCDSALNGMLLCLSEWVSLYCG